MKNEKCEMKNKEAIISGLLPFCIFHSAFCISA